ncbi:unnamed protein product [Effrenium voratum]|nr:unnamed protein product [Effrenium voratum]
MPLRCRCVHCSKVVLVDLALDPSDLSFGGRTRKCPKCGKFIRVISKWERRTEAALRHTTLASSIGLCGAAMLSCPIPAGVAPAVCAVGAMQDMVIGAAREDRWQFVSGTLGLLPALPTLAGCRTAISSVEKVASCADKQTLRAGAYMEKSLGLSKRAVDARGAVNRWDRFKSGAHGGLEVARSFYPRLSGGAPSEGGLEEVELQVFRNLAPVEEERAKCDFVDEQVLEDDGWQVLPDDASDLLRKEVELFLAEYDVLSADEFALAVSEEAQKHPLYAAIGKGTNCASVAL